MGTIFFLLINYFPVKINNQLQFSFYFSSTRSYYFFDAYCTFLIISTESRRDCPKLNLVYPCKGKKTALTVNFGQDTDAAEKKHEN